MELGQAHLNFGAMLNNDRRKKTLVVKNLSEMPLLYRITKSGSMASSTYHLCCWPRYHCRSCSG
jgi:hypothetical protein